MSNLQTITRELINQYITPEQEREWMTYWAQRPEQAAEGQARFAAGKAIAEGFLAAMRRGDAPDSPEVQKWVKRSHDNWLKPGMRERQLEQFAWNPDVTRAWSALGSKLLARSVVPDDPDEAEKLQAYMLEARRESPPARAFRPLAERGRAAARREHAGDVGRSPGAGETLRRGVPRARSRRSVGARALDRGLRRVRRRDARQVRIPGEDRRRHEPGARLTAGGPDVRAVRAGLVRPG